jgi:hypothetical protein
MNDLLQGLDFVLKQLKDWQAKGDLTSAEYRDLTERYQRRRDGIEKAIGAGQQVAADPDLPPADECWSCKTLLAEQDTHCLECGAPIRGDLVQRVRFWKYLGRLLQDHERRGVLSLANAHACITDARDALAALKQRLGRDRISAVVAAEDVPRVRRRTVQPIEAEPPRPPRRPLMEILLDPHTIQWLLALGGVLLVLGLVIYLVSLGIFEQPLAKAIAMGVGTLVMLGGGWAVVHYTRYQMAGRALTLLACLILPLNLWYYHGSELLTIENHLWIPAVLCCILYAASAWILRERTFVYVLSAGVAMTGLLILADMRRFWDIAAPSTFLVILGLIGLHVERAFPEGDGPFTRKKFGLAFFWSGQALLGGGLLLLMGAQIFGVLQPTIKTILEPNVPEFLAKQPDVWTDPPLKLLAIAIVLAGTYAYLYSDFVVRRVGVYVYFAAVSIFWAELLILHQLDLLDKPEAVIVVLALTGLAVNLLANYAGKEGTFTRSLPALGLVLCLPPVLWGVVLHFRATWLDLGPAYHYDLTWAYIGAMLLTAISCRAGAYLYRKTLPPVSVAYFFGTAAATLVGAAGLLWVLGLQTWEGQAPLLMLIPILYIIAARLYRGHTPETPLVWCAHAATAVMIVSSVRTALEGCFDPVVAKSVNLTLALFAAEAAVFYTLAAIFRMKGFNVYFATVMASGAIWQLLKYANVDNEYYTVAFAIIGIALLVAYRFAVLERFKQSGLTAAAFQSANAWLSVAFVSSVLQTISDQIAGKSSWTLVGLLAILAVLSVVAAGLVRHHAWRRWYLVITVAECLLLLITIQILSTLTVWQKLEIFSVVVGVALLVLGHIAWYREHAGERQSDLVDFSLIFGSLLAGIPLAIATLYYRFIAREISVHDEIGLLAVAITLFVTGIACRLRTTTLLGAVFGVAELVMLLVAGFMHIEAQASIAIFLAAGGAVIFAAGLLLSIYRDRLLALPAKIKRCEGVFKVLSWR